MQPRIAICVRCGGMKVGWNKRYVKHFLRCKQSLHKSSKLGGAAVVAVLILGFPTPSASGYSVPVSERPVQTVQATVDPVAAEVRKITAFLERHQVSEQNRSRLAESIVASSRKYGLNSRLIASIMIVESRGNPFAISGQDAVGIMQIHLPTWGETADRENINLLKIEDNVDFGARILNDHVRRFGVDEGIRRYNGYIPGEPTWEQSSQVYLEKVQAVYGSQQPATLQASLIR
jgi:soluble lytic murein transglycosylase-like protein